MEPQPAPKQRLLDVSRLMFWAAQAVVIAAPFVGETEPYGGDYELPRLTLMLWLLTLATTLGLGLGLAGWATSSRLARGTALALLAGELGVAVWTVLASKPTDQFLGIPLAPMGVISCSAVLLPSIGILALSNGAKVPRLAPLVVICVLFAFFFTSYALQGELRRGFSASVNAMASQPVRAPEHREPSP